MGVEEEVSMEQEKAQGKEEQMQLQLGGCLPGCPWKMVGGCPSAVADKCPYANGRPS